MTDQLVFTERKSLWSWPPMQTGPELETIITEDAYEHAGFNGNLLREDCSHVLPYSIGRRREFQPVVFADDVAAATTMIAEALPHAHGTSTIASALRAFFHGTADQLLGYRNAYYEIVYGHEPERGGSAPTAFRLLAVPSGTAAWRAGRLVQYVPTDQAEHHTEVPGVGYIELNKDALAVFRLDDQLQRDVAASFAALASAQKLWPGFDAARGSDAAQSLTSATAAIGWNGRTEPLSSEQLRPYQVYRRLECLAFKIRIREAILASLNNALDIAGRRLQTPMRIEVRDVPTLDDVQAAQEDLQHGRRGLDELAVWAAQ